MNKTYINKTHWSRRALLRGAIAAPVAGILAFRPAQGAALAVPDWIVPGKLRWVWALWEPMALYTRGGGAAGIGDQRATGHWVQKWYDRMHSDEILDKLAAAGVNVVSTHFYKGFGMKAEAAEMDRAADYTRRAHKRGIRVLGYHQFSSVMYETMLDEVPNLADWIQRGPDGRMLTYPGTQWRWKACPIHDEFMAYLRRAMDRCLLEAGMDGVEFDGTSYDCHCEKCQAAFRQYLTENNPQPLERFGIPHFRHARIPVSFDKRDPLWQEWIRFRIDLMGRRLREMRAYVHQKKPGAALVTYGDGPMGWRSDRTRLLPDQGDYLDLAVAESHDMPQILDGELVTKVPYLKEGTSLGRVVLSTDWLRKAKGGIKMPDDPRPVELDMAECLASGGHVLTATWALRSGDKRDGSAFFEQPAFYEVMKRYMGFSRDHEDLYVDSQPCANVWVYHSFASMAFDHGRAYHSSVGFERALLGRIAYRIAKLSHLPTLGPGDVLIVADQTCLSEQECREIRAAVNRRCGLILTGRSSEFDENYRQYERPALKDLQSAPRVRYFAKSPGTMKPKASTEQSAMPRETDQILKAVSALAQQGLAAELAGGDPHRPLTFVDVYRLPKGCAAHVVYYGDGEPKGFRLRVAPWLTEGKPVLYSPSLSAPVAMKPENGWIELPATFGRYAVVRFV